jgi:hypothetical protein
MCPRCMQLAKADLEPFVWRTTEGVVRFANRVANPPRFADRHWPVFRRQPRVFRSCRTRWSGPCAAKLHRSIIVSARLCAARRWLPGNPLLNHAMRVEDAARAAYITFGHSPKRFL